MSQSNRDEARHPTYMVEVRNSSFNAELNDPQRCARLARRRANVTIADFIPQTAVVFFPTGTAMTMLLDSPVARGNIRPAQALQQLHEQGEAQAGASGPHDEEMHSTS